MKIIRENIRKIKLIKDQFIHKLERQKKAVLHYPPRHVTIGITSFCNNRCVFCAYHSDDAKGKSNVYGLNYNLSLADFKKIVDMCYEGYVPRVHICGTGEPFFNKQIINMVDYCIDTYGETSLQTNFNKNIFDKHNYLDEIVRRAKHISYITTDILSGNPEQHNYLKKGSSFTDVMDAMEYISVKGKILFRLHLILTKFNYMHIDALIDEICSRKIHASLEIVNLHPHDFNKFTTIDSPYMQRDVEITGALLSAEKYAKDRNIPISIPKPFDFKGRKCGSFWSRFQTWPVKGNDKNRYHENVILGGCNAVVKGDMSSFGYIFDYDNVMDLWNNHYFVHYRTNLLKGIYPNQECKNCQNYAVPSNPKV